MSETLLEGHFVKIGDTYYRIKSREAFNYITGDATAAEFTTVVTGSESGWINIDTLEPDRDRLYQVQIGVKNGLKYQVKIPTGTNRYGVDENQNVGYIDTEKSPYFAKNQTYEFWLIKNCFPSVNAINSTGITQTPVVWFEGMKYELEKYTAQMPPHFRTITVGGLATRVIQ